MNPYLEPQGFLGTGASLLADLTLLAYIVLIVPGMLAGFFFARRNQHRPQHKTVMIVITLVNWALIIFLMLAAYRFDVAGNIGQQPGNARYLLPTIHGLFGLPAQLLATYVVYRMLREDSQVAAAKKRGVPKEELQKYWFKSAKPFMRVTLSLWLITALLGVFTYLIRYEVVPTFGAGGGQPVVTAEPLPPDVPTPAVTDEPDDNDNADVDDNGGDDDDNDNDDDVTQPAATPEATPET